MNADGHFQSSLGRIVLTVSAIIALGLVLFSVQSVIRAWRSPHQVPISNSMPVAQEQPVPEPVVPASAVPTPAGVSSGPETHDLLSDEKAARQREEAEREIMQRRAKEIQENPGAGSITNEQPVL